MKFSRNIASAAALIAISSLAHAQSYSWLTTTQASASAGANQPVNWNWSWNAGNQPLSGTLTTTRNASGSYTSGSVGSNYSVGAFSNSPYGDSVGGASGITEVRSTGSGSSTNVVYQYNLAAGTASPTNTVISLSDPGMSGLLLSNPVSTFTFAATLGGVAVDTSLWSVVIEHPNPLLGVAPSTITWNGSTLTATDYLVGSSIPPESMVYLNTNGTSFDSLTITAITPNGADYFGIGLGAPTITPVPEPSTALLATLGLLGWFARSRLGRSRDQS